MWFQQRGVTAYREGPPPLPAYPWIARIDYDRARRLMSDGDLWPHDYEIWLREAERAIRSLAEEGAEPVRVMIDIDAFEDWCNANDCPADCVARLTFAELLADSEALSTG